MHPPIQVNKHSSPGHFVGREREPSVPWGLLLVILILTVVIFGGAS